MGTIFGPKIGPCLVSVSNNGLPKHKCPYGAVLFFGPRFGDYFGSPFSDFFGSRFGGQFWVIFSFAICCFLRFVASGIGLIFLLLKPKLLGRSHFSSIWMKLRSASGGRSQKVAWYCGSGGGMASLQRPVCQPIAVGEQ